MPDDKPDILPNSKLQKHYICDWIRGEQGGPVLRGWRWAIAACDRKHEKQVLGSAVWEPVCLEWGEDGTSHPEVLAQPTHQGFLFRNSPVGSSEKEEAKKPVECVPLPSQWRNVLHREAKQQYPFLLRRNTAEMWQRTSQQDETLCCVAIGSLRFFMQQLQNC